MADADLTAARLRELLHYDPLTGLFTWALKRRGRGKQGSIAGCVGTTTGGYVVICVHGKNYGAHVLAWLYMKGCWPANLLDHRNTIKHDNRFDNLREADATLNALNVHLAPSTSQTGRRGVHPVVGLKTVTRWKASIKVNGKTRYLGRFASQEEAEAAYLAAKQPLLAAYS